MQLFKKIYVTAFGSVDSLVSRLQNHDALTAVSLHELGQKIKEAQVAFGALSRNLQRIKGEVVQVEQEEKLWLERAKSEGVSGNRESAVKCLSRAHAARRSKELLSKQHEASERSHQKLQSNIAQLQDLQRTLTLRHSELKARADFQGASEQTTQFAGGDIQEILGRWEDSLGEVDPGEIDPFEAQYRNGEERAALEAELEILLK